MGKVTAGLTSQQMLWPPADNHRRAGGQEAVLVQSSQIRDANRARLSFLAGHQSPSPTRERVFREPSWCAAGHMAQSQPSCPRHPPSTAAGHRRGVERSESAAAGTEGASGVQLVACGALGWRAQGGRRLSTQQLLCYAGPCWPSSRMGFPWATTPDCGCYNWGRGATGA